MWINTWLGHQQLVSSKLGLNYFLWLFEDVRWSHARSSSDLPATVLVIVSSSSHSRVPTWERGSEKLWLHLTHQNRNLDSHFPEIWSILPRIWQTRSCLGCHVVYRTLCLVALLHNHSEHLLQSQQLCHCLHLHSYEDHSDHRFKSCLFWP